MTASHVGFASPRGIRIALLAVTWFTAVTSIAGAAALASGVMPALGLPLALLDGSPFADYLWPGVILGVVVGGTQIAPLIAYRSRFAATWGLFAAAGLVMMIWIFIETGIIGGQSPLQLGYFAAGCTQCVLALLALGAWPSPLLRRDRP